MQEFPPNSRKSKAPEGPKRVEQVTSGAVRKRRPLGKQVRNTFFSGDARTAADYMVGNVILPALKDMVFESVSSGWERLIYGDRRPRRGPMGGGPLGHFDYQGISRGPARSPASAQRQLSRPSRARHAFYEIVISSRQEAEEVLDRLYDLLSKYESVSVAELYELTGLESSHTDQKWGWTDLRGSGVGRVRGGGYLLDLPDPEPLG